MTFLMVLAVTVAACLALRTPLHKWPVAFSYWLWRLTWPTSLASRGCSPVL